MRDMNSSDTRHHCTARYKHVRSIDSYWTNWVRFQYTVVPVGVARFDTCAVSVTDLLA